tara:strand:+ start:3915 stop:4319 length:405 start_codon:yes stop_codon:yes gene_type:complete
MKKSELKNIIKECVKEVIFEEGVLSNIITEVAQGISPLLQESTSSRPATSEMPRKATPPSQQRKTVLDAIGQNSYADLKKQFQNPEVFEGTTPLKESQQGAPLSGVDPRDPGVDISNLPGMGTWGRVASQKGMK